MFVAEHVKLLSSESAANAAKRYLVQSLRLAREMCSNDRNRDAPWTDAQSQASGKKCIQLGRSATDAPLPEDAVVALMDA